MAGTYLSYLCSCHVDRPRTYTAGNLSPERTSHMVVISCFQSCLWSCLLLLLTGCLDKLCAWLISLHHLGLMLDSIVSSIRFGWEGYYPLSAPNAHGCSSLWGGPALCASLCCYSVVILNSKEWG